MSLIAIGIFPILYDPRGAADVGTNKGYGLPAAMSNGLNMSEQTFGEFLTDRVYVDQVIASKWGKSLRETRAILRDNFSVCELGAGVLLISGRNLMAGIERMSQSPEVLDEAGNTPRELHKRRKKQPTQEATSEPEPDAPPRRRGTRQK